MKLWANDIAPDGYMHQHYWCASVDEAKNIILQYEEQGEPFESIAINPKACTYMQKGGDYYNLISWLEQTRRNYPICIYSDDDVVIENMRLIIERNGWKEVK